MQDVEQEIFNTVDYSVLLSRHKCIGTIYYEILGLRYRVIIIYKEFSLW